MFYLHFPTADSSRAVVSYWRKYGHLVLVSHLGSLPRNSVDRLTNWLDMTLIFWTGPQNLKTNKMAVLNYAPSVEVEGAYWFGPVHPSVCPSVHYTNLGYGQEP